IAKASRLYANNAPEFLRTHPVTSNRIADAISRANIHPYRQRPDSPEFFMVRADLRQRSFADPKQAVAHFQATLASKRYRDEAGEHYGYALALLRNHQAKLASLQAHNLLAANPSNLFYIILNARVDAALGRVKTASAALESALGIYPGNIALTSYYAQIAIEHSQVTDKTASYLDKTLEYHKDDPSIYALRSQVAAALGQRADSYLFLAESRFLQGEIESAVQQLGVALRTEHFDSYSELRLRSRLKELKTELAADQILKKEKQDKEHGHD
ncbi:hypothetical protein TI04_11345, partial [Achromatium sp. WMS2]